MDCTACHRNPQGSVPTDARLNSLVLLQGALHKHIQAFFSFFYNTDILHYMHTCGLTERNGVCVSFNVSLCMFLGCRTVFDTHSG